MTAERNKILERIAKLRAKGENHAVTEEEAHAFLDAAARLMAEHTVSDADLASAGMDVDFIEKKGAHVSIAKAHPACTCLEAIEKVTGTSIGLRTITKTMLNGRRREISGFSIAGRPHDREIAEYLYDQIRNLIDAAWKLERGKRLAKVRATLKPNDQHLATHKIIQGYAAEHGFGVTVKDRRSFGFGMALRLAEKLAAMASTQRQTDAAAANAVWHKALTETVDPRKPLPRLKLNGATVLAGMARGKEVDLAPGMDSGQKQVLGLE